MRKTKSRLERLEKQYQELAVDGEMMTLDEWRALHAPGGILDIEADISTEERNQRYNEYMQKHYPAFWDKEKERILRTQAQILETMAIFQDEQGDFCE